MLKFNCSVNIFFPSVRTKFHLHLCGRAGIQSINNNSINKHRQENRLISFQSLNEFVCPLHSPFYYWLVICQWGRSAFCCGGQSSTGPVFGGRLIVSDSFVCSVLQIAVTSEFDSLTGLRVVVFPLRLSFWLTRCGPRVQSFYGVSCNHDKPGYYI